MTHLTVPYPTTGDPMKELDVTRKRGLFLVVTESSTRYFVEATKKESGLVRITSDGIVVKAVREGIVGENQWDSDEPIIRLGHPLIVGNVRKQLLIVATSAVRHIVKLDGLTIEDLCCPRCKVGYKAGPRHDCHMCHYHA